MNHSITQTWRILILSLIPLLVLLMMSLRPVRLKIGDYYFKQGKFDQVVNWYGKVVRKEKLRVNQGRADLLNYERDLMKFRSSLERLNDENLLLMNRSLGIEKIKDLYIKSAMKSLLAYFDFSNIVNEGNENYVVVWVAEKAVIKPSVNEESEASERYILRWIEEKVKIIGAARLVDGPRKNSKALAVEGFPGFAKIFGPPSAVNSSEGSLAVWARLTDPGKNYSVLVNASEIIYIFHQGSNGKFVIQYNNVRNSSDLIIEDNKWHHYIFTWREGDQKFYIDGTKVLDTRTPASTANITIFAVGWLGSGNGDSGAQWHGPLAYFLTFDRALTACEAAALYRSGESSGQ